MSKVKEFERLHKINIGENWNDGEESVYNILVLREISYLIYSGLKEEDYHIYPTVGIVFELIGRVYDQIIGGITCICTNNYASSEVLSRTVIESSVNILYMLKDDTESKTFSWLKKYVAEDLNNIKYWEESLKHEKEKEIHLPRIKVRKELNEYKKDFVDNFIQQVTQINVNDIDYPRKVLKLFEEVGEAVSYHTVYSRLSATTHLKAEDTLSYMMAIINGNQKNIEDMKKEGQSFSEFMLVYSLLFYAKVISQFNKKYAQSSDSRIEEIKKFYYRKLTNIAEKWGW